MFNNSETALGCSLSPFSFSFFALRKVNWPAFIALIISSFTPGAGAAFFSTPLLSWTPKNYNIHKPRSFYTVVRLVVPILSARSCKAILLRRLLNGTLGGSADAESTSGIGKGGGGGGGGAGGDLSFSSAFSALSMAACNSDSTSFKRSSRISTCELFS